MKLMIMHSAVYVPIDWLGGLDGKILSGHKDRAYIQMYGLSTVTAKYFPFWLDRTQRVNKQFYHMTVVLDVL